MKFDEFTELCKKHGLMAKEYSSDYTLPYITNADFLCVYDFNKHCAKAALDVRKLEKWEKGKNVWLGFQSEEYIVSIKELEERIIFLKKRYKEMLEKIKLDRIKRDF
jgi:predicted ATPase